MIFFNPYSVIEQRHPALLRMFVNSRAQMLVTSKIPGVIRTTAVVLASTLLLAACGEKSARTVASGSTQTVSGAIPDTSGTTTSSGSTATGSATLSWTPPLQNTDGSALTDLAGYKIYYGTSLAALDHVIKLTTSGNVVYTVQNLGPGTWFFTVRAYNSAGVESEFSGTASKTIS